MMIGGARLTVETIAAFGRGSDTADYAAAGRERIHAGHEALLQLAEKRPVYGLSTGVGARRSATVQRDTESCLRLWRSHAVQIGPAVDRARTRAMMLIRAQQIARGGSGVSLPLAELLLTRVNSAHLPRITYGSSLGTGDLAALAATALQITETDGEFSPSDGLPFMSSSALTAADAAITLADFRTALNVATDLGAATAHLARGTSEHFSERAVAERPAATRDIAARMRQLEYEAGRRVQDPFALRLIPQSLGSVLAAWQHCVATVEELVDSSNENPVVLFDPLDVAHTGNFSTVELALATDNLTRAIAQEANLLLSRISLLMHHQFTGAADFLSDGDADSSGAMMLEYTAGAALGQIRDAASPHGGQGIHISQGAEEYAPFTPLAVRRLASAVEAYRLMLACLATSLSRLPNAQRLLSGLSDNSAELVDRDLSPELAEILSELDSIQLRVPQGQHENQGGQAK